MAELGRRVQNRLVSGQIGLARRHIHALSTGDPGHQLHGEGEDAGQQEGIGSLQEGRFFGDRRIHRGHVHGSTDELGYTVTSDPVGVHDLQATILHLFGLDHQQLVFLYNGRQQSLTNGRPCRVVSEILERSS
mgnify:CR=1 FL=1